MGIEYPVPYKLNSGSAEPVVSPILRPSSENIARRVRTDTIGVIALPKALPQARSGLGFEMTLSRRLY